jgi:hypothetical protein
LYDRSGRANQLVAAAGGIEMSRYWLGLLLLGGWIGASDAAPLTGSSSDDVSATALDFMTFRFTSTDSVTTGISFPMVTDFQGVDIDGPTVIKTILLTNNGDAAFDVTSIAEMTGASPAFSVMLPPGATQLQPGASLPLPVTYKPTVEQPANQPDTMVLVADLAGIAGGPSQVMLTF